MTNFECDVCGEHTIDCVCNQYSFNIRIKSFKETVDTLVEGIIQAHKECPDAENKTFDEVADWAGKHVLITERKDEEPIRSRNVKLKITERVKGQPVNYEEE